MKVFIAGSTIVFASELKKEDVELVGIYEPDVLALKDGDDVTFRVAIGECAEVGKFGTYPVTLGLGDCGLYDYL